MNVSDAASQGASNEAQEMSVQELTLGAPILVLAPHPDDESLGCGALLSAAFADTGASVVCVTDGGCSHPGSQRWDQTRLAVERQRELVNAVAALGGTHEDVFWLGFQDGAAPHHVHELQGAVDWLAQHCSSRGIRRVFATSPADAHADHQSTALLARTLCEEVASLSLLEYPVWSRWENFRTTGVDEVSGAVRFDTTRWLTQKRKAIACHRSQLGQVVTDDPDGFVMPARFVALFESGDEWFFQTD
ncbi:PIG-L deacetylase family protein [Granulosicoccus sp. 3-233]|uniref:PIG-L deacetylase family protein n=1 Tax=Granulosicoccus sp. 3-233 TaxID=3417969 RepID=UPI003D329563